jgi:hypothetical protein
VIWSPPEARRQKLGFVFSGLPPERREHARKSGSLSSHMTRVSTRDREGVRVTAANKASFKKGNQVALGNRGGGGARPRFMTQAMISELQRMDGRGPHATPKFHKIVKHVVDNALRGDMDAIKFCMDRVEGTPVAAVELTSPDGTVGGGGVPQLLFNFGGMTPQQIVDGQPKAMKLVPSQRRPVEDDE